MAVAAVRRITSPDSAQVLVFFALVLPLILLPAAAYAIDAAAAASAYARLEEVTVRSAEEAAQQLDASRLRSGGGIGLDIAAAVARAHDVMRSALPAARVISVAVSGATVTVRVDQVVTLPLQLIGRPEVTLHAMAVARLAVGYESPSSLLPLPTSTF